MPTIVLSAALLAATLVRLPGGGGGGPSPDETMTVDS